MTTHNERQGSGHSVNEPNAFVSPYENTKTGLIGEQRDTMLQSELQHLVEYSTKKMTEIFERRSHN